MYYILYIYIYIYILYIYILYIYILYIYIYYIYIIYIYIYTHVSYLIVVSGRLRGSWPVRDNSGTELKIKCSVAKWANRPGHYQCFDLVFVCVLYLHVQVCYLGTSDKHFPKTSLGELLKTLYWFKKPNPGRTMVFGTVVATEMLYTPWQSNMAMENSTFINDFLNKNW